MDKLLTEIKSTSLEDENAAFIIRESSAHLETQPQSSPAIAKPSSDDNVTFAFSNNLDDVLSVLRNEPSISSVRAVLKQINITFSESKLNLGLPGPGQAKIINTLIETIIPTFWQVFEDADRQSLALSMTNVAGFNAILAKLRQYSAVTKSHDGGQRCQELLQLVRYLLSDIQVLSKLWHKISCLQSSTTKHNLIWKEVVNLLGSGRLLSVPAEAQQVLHSYDSDVRETVITGTRYAEWLASNIMLFASDHHEPARVAQLLGKALSLGYNETIASTMIRTALCSDSQGLPTLSAIISELSPTSKRRYLEATGAWLSGSVPSSMEHVDRLTASSHIAALLQVSVVNDDNMRQQLGALVLDTQISASQTLIIRHAALFVLSLEPTFDFSSILEKSLLIFGDRLFIDHTPSQQQDALAQNILISAGLLHRHRPAALTNALRSAKHLQAVSNRLASSGTRARWLGMIVGTALSRLTDRPGSMMDFGTADMHTTEASEWLRLTTSTIELGDVAQLLTTIETSQKKKQALSRRITKELPIINGKQAFGPVRPPGLNKDGIQGSRVTELQDDTDEDDLIPYAKPDSDPEDSDEDATLVNRNKARPPVYVRTLMAMLRDTENADKFQLALKHAAPLIRRKTGFGREVSDHAEELARILANLQDAFETDDFDTQRLQALIAVVLSDVPRIAPWLARQAFAKDYSTAQRAIMLTALGLSGRELAGFKHEDSFNVELDNTTFPSKRLPPRLHSIYSPPLLESATKSVESSIIQPMALAAADQTTSHLDAVKVRKFSSRMDIQRTRRKPAANELAKIFYTSYFEPLLSSFQRDVAANGDSSAYTSSPVLLTTFLKTLALLLHASGPATSHLDQVTSEFWELLLYLRIKAVGDITILEALLFSFLTLLEANGDKQTLAMNNPKQLMETKEWAEMVFEHTGGGNLIEGEGEEARVRTLSAGVLTKVSDIIGQYQKTLMSG